MIIGRADSRIASWHSGAAERQYPDWRRHVRCRGSRGASGFHAKTRRHPGEPAPQRRRADPRQNQSHRVRRLCVGRHAVGLQRRRRYGENPHGKQDYGRGLGSSIGSAAGVAAALAPVAIGSETQNSIQTPASVTSVYGFKPSVGRVSRAGVVPLVPSQDSPGLLVRSMDDIMRVMPVIACADCRDSMTIPAAIGSLGKLHRRDAGTIRIGVPRRAIADRADLQGVMAQSRPYCPNCRSMA